MSEVGRVAQQGAAFITSTQSGLIQRSRTTDTEARGEWDFTVLLKGPATFIRLVANNNCRLFFWHEIEGKWVEFYEGLIADIPLRIIDENWTKIVVIGPVGTVVTVYASRIPGSGGVRDGD